MQGCQMMVMTMMNGVPYAVTTISLLCLMGLLTAITVGIKLICALGVLE